MIIVITKVLYRAHRENILLRQLQWEVISQIRRPRKQRLNITMFLASEVWLHLGGG